MIQQKPIDLQRLWELAHQGKDAEEIMRELDITEMAALKNAMKNLVDEKGEHFKISGLDEESSVDEGKKKI